MSHSVDEIVARHAPNIVDKYVHFRPSIPAGKIENALQTYAKDVSADEVLALVDESLSHNAKDGALLTAEGFYAHNLWQKPMSIDLADVESIQFKPAKMGSEILINGKTFLSATSTTQAAVEAFTRLLAEMVVERARGRGDEALRAEWNRKRHALIASLETTKPSELPKSIGDLELLAGKLEMGEQARAVDLDQCRLVLKKILAKAGRNDRPGLARLLVTVYERLGGVSEFLEGPDADIRLRMEYLQFAESCVDELLPSGSTAVSDWVRLLGGEGAAIGYASGMKDHAKQNFLSRLQEERLRLLEAGKIRAIGFCKNCKQLYNLDPNLECPTSAKHKIKEVVFTMPDQAVATEQEMRRKFKLGAA